MARPEIDQPRGLATLLPPKPKKTSSPSPPWRPTAQCLTPLQVPQPLGHPLPLPPPAMPSPVFGLLSLAHRQPTVRLSVRHGMPLEAIAEHVSSFGQLALRQLAHGMPEQWVPVTPRLEECYEIGREIGRGHFGVVRMCLDKETRQKRACKTILKASIKAKEDVAELSSEVVTMLRLQGGAREGSSTLSSSSKFVELHEVLEDADAVHLVMDFCAGGDLFDFISHKKKLSEKEAASVMRQLAKAVRHMHRCGLVHRDLKPENILLAEDVSTVIGHQRPNIKVADFGLCADLEEGKMVTGLAGSPFYMAPEVIMRQPYDERVDTWSLGVILYTCLSGTLPFWGQGNRAVFESVLRGRVEFVKKPWPLVSPEAKNLIRSMLRQDPRKRIALEDVLTHPWFRKFASPESRRDGAIRLSQQQPTVFQFQQQSLPLCQNPWATKPRGQTAWPWLSVDGGLIANGTTAQPELRIAIPSGGEEELGPTAEAVSIAEQKQEEFIAELQEEGTRQAKADKSGCCGAFTESSGPVQEIRVQVELLHAIPSPLGGSRGGSPAASPVVPHSHMKQPKLQHSLSLAHPFSQFYAASPGRWSPASKAIVIPLLDLAQTNAMEDGFGLPQNTRSKAHPRASDGEGDVVAKVESISSMVAA